MNEGIRKKSFLTFFLQNLENDERPLVDATKLSTIRLKLEEKRRHIEQEKRKMEAALSKQQQKVGKAAFLQAITKVMGRFKIYLKLFVNAHCIIVRKCLNS